MLEFIHPEDHALVLDRHVRRLRGEDVPSTYPLRMLRKDGTSFWTQLNAVAIEWKGRTASLNFIRDISEQKRFEEQLAAAERLRSIGTLAGGIAHDFNNILMGIQGTSRCCSCNWTPRAPCAHAWRTSNTASRVAPNSRPGFSGSPRGGSTTPSRPTSTVWCRRAWRCSAAPARKSKCTRPSPEI